MAIVNLLSVEDAAAQLNVSISCVYDLVEQRRLQHVRIGIGRGRIRILPHDLQQFIKKNTISQQTTRPTRRSASAPSAFTKLDGARLRAAWKEQGVE